MNSRARRRAAVATALGVWLQLGQSAAETASEESSSAPAALYLPVGFSMGASYFPDDGLGAFIGAELSLALLSPAWNWFGGYVDTVYDTGTQNVRSSVGLELGSRYVGVDAGYVLDASDPDGLRHGVVVRPMLTTGLLSLGSRFGYLMTGQTQLFFEAGLLVKYPIDLDH